MNNVVEFKQPEKKFVVTICGSDGLIQTFEAEMITRPQLESEEHEVWFGDEVILVPGPRTWGPITITGLDDIGYAIRYSLTPPRVTFESSPRSNNWWELHNVYLATESTSGEHIIRFENCTEHKYSRTDPKY